MPVEFTGKEYIVIKGNVTTVTAPGCPADGGERIFITATQPNTQITIDNILVDTLIGAGQVFSYQIDNPTVYVRASKPVYINHITGFGGELGGAVLPAIDNCTGSTDVTFTRTPNVTDGFLMNLMARNATTPGNPLKNQSAKSFTILSNGVITVIPESYFDYVIDSTWIVLKRNPAVNSYIASQILPGKEARISNSVTSFHLGIICGGATSGCKYGYFSNYSSTMPGAGIGNSKGLKEKSFCSMDSTLLVASGGRSYKWFGSNDPADTALLNNTTSDTVVFKPVVQGYYKFGVHIYGECFNDTVIFMQVIYAPSKADLEIIQEVCPGEPVLINNNGFASKTRLIIDEDPYMEVDLPYTFQFENTTDSVVTKRVILINYWMFPLCPDQDTAFINIYPAVHADFQVNEANLFYDDTAHFTNQSAGNNLSYLWNFGDGTQSTDINPSHIFSHVKDTVFTVGLIATNEFLCADTMKRPITLHTRISHDSIPLSISSDIFYEDCLLDEWLYLRITDTTSHLVWYDSLATVTKAHGFNDTVYLDSGIYKCEILDMGANVSMPVITIGSNHIVPWGYPEYEYYLFTLPGIFNTESELWKTACDSLVSPSSKYTWFASGIYVDTIPNFENYDSVITIHLTIANTTFSTLNRDGLLQIYVTCRCHVRQFRNLYRNHYKCSRLR